MRVLELLVRVDVVGFGEKPLAKLKKDWR